MSDCETDFESASEGSKGDDGWEVDSDMDFPILEQKSAEAKPLGLLTVIDDGNTGKYGDADSNSVLQSGFDRLSVDEKSCTQNVFKESQIIPNNEVKPSCSQSSSSWGNWSSGWSVNSLISTANALTNQVSQGITNVIGAPTPEQLATVDGENTEISNDKSVDQLSESVLGTNYFLSNVSQITKIVENTSSKIISGGLGTLETVGKKTLEVLQEGDPGLRKKRALFFQNNGKINLSQVLQEAKEKAEIESKQNNLVELKKGYAYLLDSFQGLIHLESLELLSKQCQMKLQTVLLSCSGTQLTDIQDSLEQIKELCYLDCDDDDKLISGADFKNSLSSYINKISVDVKTEKILRVSDLIDKKSNGKFVDENNIHDEAISALAELTAAAMELYYKLGEMLMIDPQNENVIVKAKHLSLLNEVVCCRIRSIANQYACLLTTFDADNTSNDISDIYLESSNSSSYIQDAAQLLVPILQLSVI